MRAAPSIALADDCHRDGSAETGDFVTGVTA
jgi:hypothetical protein